MTPPKHKNIVGSRWTYKLKKNSDGSIAKYKARLVAKGYSQQFGFDFNETFSLVVKPITIRIIMIIALTNQWNIRKLDMNNAFLNGELKEEAYMQQPRGYVSKENERLVCKLHKAIYGLKQASRVWYEKLKVTFCQIGVFFNKVRLLSVYQNQSGHNHIHTRLHGLHFYYRK